MATIHHVASVALAIAYRLRQIASGDISLAPYLRRSSSCVTASGLSLRMAWALTSCALAFRPQASVRYFHTFKIASLLRGTLNSLPPFVPVLHTVFAVLHSYARACSMCLVSTPCLTIRSSRTYFVASNACLRYASRHSPPLRRSA